VIIKLFFWINLSLFILHEMDAVKTREWKMMIFMNRLDDNTGHVVFTALHFILFLLIFYLMDVHFNFIFPLVSGLLILHQFAHIFFRKHSENRMNNIFSQVVIFLMFINSTVSLIYYYIIF
jgi:hypothetical protein